MRLDQMFGAGFMPEKRKRLSELEKQILLRALAVQTQANPESNDMRYAVAISMAMPSGFLDRLHREVATLKPMWPGFEPDPEQWEPSPIELIGYDSTDAGLWSILPSRLYRRTTRHGESPDRKLIEVTSEILDFCGWCAEVFKHNTRDEWEDSPPLLLRIESTHFLVASQAFDSEDDGGKWLSLAQEIFNSIDFAKALEEYDQGAEEEPGFRGPSLVTMVEARYRGWLPCKGLPTQEVRSLVSHLRDSGIQNPDRSMAKAFASLRDRGYVDLRGEFQSPDTRWIFPAECVLTGTGYLRASRLAESTGRDPLA
jgi:hypothetical protein